MLCEDSLTAGFLVIGFWWVTAASERNPPKLSGFKIVGLYFAYISLFWPGLDGKTDFTSCNISYAKSKEMRICFRVSSLVGRRVRAGRCLWATPGLKAGASVVLQVGAWNSVPKASGRSYAGFYDLFWKSHSISSVVLSWLGRSKDLPKFKRRNTDSAT